MDPILTFTYRPVLPPTLITDELDQTDGLLTVHDAAPCRPIRKILDPAPISYHWKFIVTEPDLAAALWERGCTTIGPGEHLGDRTLVKHNTSLTTIASLLYSAVSDNIPNGRASGPARLWSATIHRYPPSDGTAVRPVTWAPCARPSLSAIRMDRQGEVIGLGDGQSIRVYLGLWEMSSCVVGGRQSRRSGGGRKAQKPPR